MISNSSFIFSPELSYDLGKYWLILNNIHLYYIFFINPAVKRFVTIFPLYVQSINFFIITFATLNCLVCLLLFFFIKRSNNFFTAKITNKICPRYSIFNFFNHKNLSWPIWSVTFSTKCFYSLIFLHDCQL